jgi:hypothetical protein
VLQVRFNPPVAMLPMMIQNLPPQTPPPVVAIVENLESVALDVDEKRFSLTLTVAEPKALEPVKGMWDGLVAMAKAKIDEEEKAGRAAMKDAPTMMLLSPEAGRSARRQGGIPRALKLDFAGKGQAVLDNPFPTSLRRSSGGRHRGRDRDPELQKARESARGKACFANMRVLEGACELKMMDSAERQKKLTIDELVEETISSRADVPQGGAYTLDLGGEARVSCSKHGRWATQPVEAERLRRRQLGTYTTGRACGPPHALSFH